MSPEPLAVNMAVWEIRKCMAANPAFYILVHCTHGFNRSGALVLLCNEITRTLPRGGF